jgi:hypothetical protein
VLADVGSGLALPHPAKTGDRQGQGEERMGKGPIYRTCKISAEATWLEAARVASEGVASRFFTETC